MVPKNIHCYLHLMPARGEGEVVTWHNIEFPRNIKGRSHDSCFGE